MVIPKNNSIPGMHEAIGSAISSWTKIENNLYQIFAVCLSLVIHHNGAFTIETQTPAAVLDAIDGFRGKLRMIDAAIANAIPWHDAESVAIRNDWAAERDRVSGLHTNRNSLAHWTVFQNYNGKGPNKVILMPPQHGLPTAEGVVRTDVERWQEGFLECAGRLGKIVMRLAEHKALQRRFVQLTANQIRNTLPDDPTLLEYLKQQLSEHL
jgi:hypothetical protein